MIERAGATSHATTALILMCAPMACGGMESRSSEGALDAVPPPSADATTGDASTTSDVETGFTCPTEAATWSRRFGAPSALSQLSGLAVDPSNDVILSGTFSGTLDFGVGPLTATPGTETVEAGTPPPTVDVFVAKLDPFGNAIWARRFGDEKDQIGYRVAVDALGNIVIVGSFEGSIDFGDGPIVSKGDKDAFVTKLDPWGNVIWTRVARGDGWDYLGFVAIDPMTGDVVASGFTTGDSVDCGLGPEPASGQRTAILVRFDASGTVEWARVIAASPDSGPHPDFELDEALGVSRLGDGFVGAYLEGSVDLGFGSVTTPTGGNFPSIIARFDAGGRAHWAEPLGRAGWDCGDGFIGPCPVVGLAGSTSTPDDGVVLTGGFSGAVDFGGGVLNSTAGSGDIFVASFDADGRYRWSNRFGDSSNQGAGSIAMNGSGHLLLTGAYDGTLDPTLGRRRSHGADVFFMELDSSGALLRTAGFGEDSKSQAGGIIVADRCDAPILAGSFDGTIDFGEGPLTSLSGMDIFVAKIAP